MKLYLSSYRIPDVKAFSNFVGKLPRDIKFCLILNAKDNKTPWERAEKAKELTGYFSQQGFSVEELDLRDYIGKQEDLKKKLGEFDVLWLNGGNTYFLRSAIAQSKSEDILKKVFEGGVVYGGDSAGAIIAGQTLKYFDAADDPSGLPSVIYEGLGFVDFSVLPHWDSVKFHDILEGIKKHLEVEGHKTIPLTDSAFLLIEDGRVLN